MAGRLFFLGSLPSVIPFACTTNTNIALIICSICTGGALFGVGAWKTRTTRGIWWKDGLENLIVGTAGALLSYGVGAAFEAIRIHYF